MKSRNDAEARLVEAVAGFARDPLGVCAVHLPVGGGGNAVADSSGPRAWQTRVLEIAGEKLREAHSTGIFLPIQIARGVGARGREIDGRRLVRALGDVDDAGRAGRGDGEHRHAAAHEDVAGVHQVAADVHERALVPGDGDGDLLG